MKKYIIAVILSSFFYISLGYAKNNDSILQSIFIGFAKGAIMEVSRHLGEETTKFYFKNDDDKNSSENIENILDSTIDSWNLAINNRDINALYDLYGYKVLYYGSKLKDEKCIKDKKIFYKKYPLFHQSIKNISYKKISQNLYKLSFEKFVKFDESKPIEIYPSYLVVDTSFSSPSILVEGDKITDKNLLKRYNK